MCLYWESCTICEEHALGSGRGQYSPVKNMSGGQNSPVNNVPQNAAILFTKGGYNSLVNNVRGDNIHR